MASTYVNNLRLEEIGTGEQSGTWGDTTNTNLEIIGQAVAWGTRAIANASTDNITIADGALDADRCLGLKLTGGGQACTVSLLPNTSSKTWFMYNATAAALTFTCGSGANVIIPAGQTKVIATDGLGSGGVVHDLLTAVNLAGTTTVDDLIVSDDLVVADDASVGGILGVTGVLTTTAATVSNGGGQFNGAINVGVDDTGYDVKFFGATASAFMQWDASTDDLLLGGASRLGIGTAAPATALEISTDGTDQLTLNRADASISTNNTLGAIVVTADDPSADKAGAKIGFTAGGNWATNSFPTNIIFSNDASGTMTERMRIDGSGGLLIGTSTEGHADADELTISGSGAVGMTLRSTNSNQNSIFFSDGTSGSPEYAGFLQYNHANNFMNFGTNATERMRITAAGNIGIGTTSPNAPTAIVANTTSYEGLELVTPNGDASGEFHIGVHDNGGTSGRNIVFKRGGSDGMDTESMRITTAGQVLIGPSASRTVQGFATSLQVEGTSATTSSMQLVRNSNSVDPPYLNFGKSRATATGGVTAVANNDILGEISWTAADGTDLNNVAATIQGIADAAVSGNDTPGRLVFRTTADGAYSTTERMRINNAGEVLIGKTVTSLGTAGVRLNSSGGSFSRASGGTLTLNVNANGTIVSFYNSSSLVGQIGSVSGTDLYIAGNRGTNSAGLKFTDKEFFPVTKAGATQNGVIDIGHSGGRYNDIYAVNATIQTSDRTEKQDIAALTSAEMLVAKRISVLFKTFRWKDKVAAKGDNARTHSGIIAQDVQAAFEAESLDAGDYSMFISTTWWDHNFDVAAVEADDTVDPAIEAADAYTHTNTYNTEDEAPSGSISKTRLGIRYPELLSFLAAYNEQRFAAIETRLTALEG